MENIHITVIDGNRQAQSFAALDAAVAHITHAPHETFTIYAPRDVYAAIRKQVVEQANREDYDSIYNYRMMKGSVTSWGDIDDLNDMIDAVEERIRKRERRLSYDGEKKEDRECGFS